MTDKRFNPEKAQSLMRNERKKSLPPDMIIEQLQVNAHELSLILVPAMVILLFQ